MTKPEGTPPDPSSCSATARPTINGMAARAGAEELKNLFPDTDFAFSDPAYHAITYSHPEAVASHVIGHLSGKLKDKS